MKNIFLLILSITSSCVTGQVRVFNASLKNSDSSILYRDIDNRLQLEGNIKSKRYNVVGNGQRLVVTDSFFTISPANTNDVKVEVWDGRQVVSSRIFRIDTVGPPHVTLGGQVNNFLTRQMICANSYLVLNRTNCQLKLLNRFYGFRCLTIGKRIGTKEFSLEGPRFSAELIQEIKKMEPGDKIRFENIKIGILFQGSAGCARAYDPFEVTII